MDNKEKGYVIRHHNLFDGSTWFKGSNGTFARTKAGISVGDTYTLSGAKRALSNYQRMYPDFESQYSVERLDDFYCFYNEDADLFTKNKNEINQSFEKAMRRLDELWERNVFNNSDKMRINEIKAALRMLNEQAVGKTEK